MAKAKSKETERQKSLVIVESPAKARTIGKFLGPAFTVEASIGHIRDLPSGAKEVPAKFKKEDWAYLGVNVHEDFTPIYIIPSDKKNHVAKLKDALAESKELYLATDEDREGEAISWHLCEVLKPEVPVRRLVFHEITKEAIDEALQHPREIDDALVRAQETRRILDRLYGYDVSQLLWRKVKPKLSAGRVQSVAVRLIVERERERMAFHSATYWDLAADFVWKSPEGNEQGFRAELVSVNGRKVPSGRDFDPATGKIKDSNLLLLDEAGVRELAERLRTAEFRVTAVETRPYTTKPAPPFTTSTLQQEANRKLGFTARETMRAAQSLYENGHITYMRTDSTNLAQVAIDAARDLVREQYGAEYLPPSPRLYRSNVKNAQEAHEAIRPAGHPFELPEVLRNVVLPNEFKLFEMIWKRTISSQMEDARGQRISVTIEGGGAVFQCSGKTIDFPGFLRAYVEGSDNPEAELADKESLLPPVSQGEGVGCRELKSLSHTTQPPSRYSEAALTQELEQKGIGRPSTYASIIETIQAREYVFKKGNALVPTWTAFAVCRLLEEHFSSLVDYEFTAQMEDFLDSVSRREAEHLTYLRRFYFGNGNPGLRERVETKQKEIDPALMSRFEVGRPSEGPWTDPIYVRVGRFGPFLEQGERNTEHYRKASLPAEMCPDEVTLEKSLELLSEASKGDEPIGHDPATQQPIYLKSGRFGAYVQLGMGGQEEKPKYASLLRGMKREDVTLDVALQLLALPRTLGEHPQTHEPVIAANGRYGPYVKCGTETRSLTEEQSPLTITLEQACELLAQPKARGRGRAAKREPLKVFAASPVTNEPVKLLDGRYGHYVTDGETNASLPRGADPEALTFEQALALLAERAAMAPPSRRKKTAKKTATKKAAAAAEDEAAPAKKKPAKKKATKKAKKPAVTS